MKSLLLTGFIIAMVASCDKERNSNSDHSSVPACIQTRIDDIKKQPKWNPPAEVNEYLYNGKKVYLFNANCCDQFITLVDDSCNPICAPSGGITGSGDRNCPDFYQKAHFIRLIWKDPR